MQLKEGSDTLSSMTLFDLYPNEFRDIFSSKNIFLRAEK